MEHLNDWDLQAVVRSCSFSGPASHEAEATPPPAACPEVIRGPARPAAAAATLQELEYLDLDHELSKPFLVSSAQVRAVDHEVVFSFPAAGQPGRKPGVRTPRPKRSKKSQLKKVVFEVPVADGGVSSDLWAWRKYGQKPIKGSPYPRGYYKCSSLKGCMARKMVERSPAKPGVLIVTYMAEHCHPVPTQLNALSGTTRHKPSSTAPPDDHCSPKSPGKAAAGEDRNGASAMAVDGCAEMADDENELWLGLDEFLGHMDGDFGHVFEECAVLGRRLSL